jgi:hypothetical protein
MRAPLYVLSALLVFGGCSKKPHLSSSASIMIQPGVSFGAVRSGSTMQDVINSLGEPEERNERQLKYFNLGLVVDIKSNAVHTISCLQGSTQDGVVKKSFAGHTQEGIGLGSSKEDIVAAYGEPTAVESDPKAPDIEVLRYKPLGLFFMLRDGKVLVMSVIFQTQKP